MRKLFSVAGTVTSVRLLTEPGTGALRGCGYVIMSTEDEAEQAISLLNGALLGDGQIVVKSAPKKFGKKAGPSPGGKAGASKGRPR